MKKALFLAVSILLLCCSYNNEDINNGLPTLTTNNVTNILPSKAVSGGSISNDGGENIINRGICWNTNGIPTLNNNSIVDNKSGIGEYSIDLSDLESNTVYYLRAFATNSLGTSYGNELNFTTLKDIIYDVLFFEFTPDIGNNTSRLKCEIQFNNPNHVTINGFYIVTIKITANGGSLVCSDIIINPQCSEIIANSSCIISYEEESLDFEVGISSIELISVDYYITQ